MPALYRCLLNRHCGSSLCAVPTAAGTVPSATSRCQQLEAPGSTPSRCVHSITCHLAGFLACGRDLARQLSCQLNSFWCCCCDMACLVVNGCSELESQLYSSSLHVLSVQLGILCKPVCRRCTADCSANVVRSPWCGLVIFLLTYYNAVVPLGCRSQPCFVSTAKAPVLLAAS